MLIVSFYLLVITDNFSTVLGPKSNVSRGVSLALFLLQLIIKQFKFNSP